MHRITYILLLFLLAHTYTAHAQQGQDLDDLDIFEFLKAYPNCGDYRFEKDPRNIYAPRIQFLSAANFKKAQFDSTAVFQEMEFNFAADFEEARFNSSAIFPVAQFDSRASFFRTQFDSGAYFEYAEFDSEAVFGEARCSSEITFYSAQFNSRASFYQTQFDSTADFQAAQFNAIANFRNAQFNSQTNFYGTEFHSLASFYETQFHSYSDFSNSYFHAKADFSLAHFKGDVDFTATTLPDTLVFQKVKIATEIDLTTTQVDSVKKAQGLFCLIDLRDAPIEKFKLRYDNFRVFWPNSITSAEYERLTNVYEGLLKNFKDRGYLTSYATLDKEYQAFKDLQNPDASSIKKLLNRVNYYWNNYGYNKEWIWLWTLAFMSFSTLVNWLAFPYLIKKVYPVPMIDKALFKGKIWKQKQFTGIPLFWNIIRLNFQHFRLAFFYTCLIFFGLKISTERINFDKYGGVTLIFTEYLIGLICLGYLANFIISSGLIGK